MKEAYTCVAMQFGENNITCGVILNSMGMLYKKQQKYERALDAYQRCQSIREEHMGDDHPDTVAVRHNIAELYIQWAMPEKAKEYLEKNIEVMKKKEKEEGAAADVNIKEEDFF